MHFEIPFLSAILKSCDRLASSEVSLHTWNASWCIANHELIMTYRYGKVTTYDDDEGIIITNRDMRVGFFTHINWNQKFGFLRQMTPNLGFFLSEISVKPTTSLLITWRENPSRHNCSELIPKIWVTTYEYTICVHFLETIILFFLHYIWKKS